MPLELKMSLLRAVFECTELPIKNRRNAFKAYAELHAQRSPKTVKAMEERAGLSS